MISRSLYFQRVFSIPRNVLGGGSVRSRSGTRYVLGLKIRASLFLRKRNSRTWTANTIMATPRAVRKLTMPIPSLSSASLVVVVVAADVVAVDDTKSDCVLEPLRLADPVMDEETAELRAELMMDEMDAEEAEDAADAEDDSASVDDPEVSVVLDAIAAESTLVESLKRGGEGGPIAGRDGDCGLERGCDVAFSGSRVTAGVGNQ